MGSPSVYPFLLNLRSYAKNIIESRPGTVLISAVAAAVHSLKRLNDSIPGATLAWTRLVGSADKLYSGQMTFTQIASGLSGNPLALVDYRPVQSPESWVYVGDSNKMLKVKTDGTTYNDGVAPPLIAPTVAIGPIVTPTGIIEEFNEAGVGSWTPAGTASALTANGPLDILNDTIGTISYDSGTTGWATVTCAGTWPVAGVANGTFVTINDGNPTAETVPISGIQVSSGTAHISALHNLGGGVVEVVSDVPPSSSALLGITTGSSVIISQGNPNQETVTVISVITGSPFVTFTCNLTLIHNVGESLVLLNPTHIPVGFRCFLANTHATGETVEAGDFGFQVALGTGDIEEVLPIDLSGEPTDVFSICVLLDDITHLGTMALYFDVDAVNQDFAHNAFYFGFGASFIKTPAGASIADSQWGTVTFKESDLSRIGSDVTRSMADVDKVKIQVVASGAVNVKVSSWFLTPTSGPVPGPVSAPYQYRFRYRSSETGAVSNPGPYTRVGIQPNGNPFIVTASASSDPQADLIDYYRYGGALTDWRYVGTSPNSSPTFTDTQADADIASNDLATFDDFRPFPTVDIPRSGTCNITGSQVTWVSGDTFNVLWAPGSLITIDQIVYTLYNYPSDSTHLEIVESGPVATGVPFLLKQATLDAQPLPCVWGPFLNMLLACGSDYEPGKLFMTKGNNPDSAPDTYNIEITPPTEPLMNGCVFGGFTYVYSNKRAFNLSQDYTGQNLLLYTEIPNAFGLFSRWGLCTGDFIYGLWQTGIWRSDGGPSVMITDPDLTLLFPHDGQPGQAVTLGSVTFQPPDFTAVNALRLSWADYHLRFDYIDVNQQPTTLVWNEIFNRWGPDIYAFNGTAGAVCHYQEEGAGIHSNLIGGSDGGVYQESGTDDNGNSFPADFRMPQVGAPSGYQHARDGYIGLMSGAVTNLIVNVEGTDYTQPMASTASLYDKVYSPLPAMKGRTFEWGIKSTGPWRLWINDTFFRVKQWAGEQYERFQPFKNLRREL